MAENGFYFFKNIKTFLKKIYILILWSFLIKFLEAVWDKLVSLST